MFRSILCSIALVAGTALAVHADPKDDVTSAAQKLTDSPNYSWTTTVENAAQGGFTPGPQEGKTEKDGFTTLSLSFGDNTTLIVMKGGKAAIQSPDDNSWHTADELTGPDAQPGPATFMARMAMNYKPPVVQVNGILDKLTTLTQADDAYTADLTDDQLKPLMMGGRRGGGGGNGGQPPQIDITNGKGTVKFWIKDGVLSKYEIHVSGSVVVNGGDPRDVDRTTTTEFKDVGSTTITVPDDAKAKLPS
jgi:hypothetical protein